MKDDSGSYAVFTEQGSSASQMTAAKVSGHCFKTTRKDAQDKQQMQLSAYTQVTNGRCTNVILNSQIRNALTFGYVYRNTSMEEIMVQYGRSSRSS